MRHGSALVALVLAAAVSSFEARADSPPKPVPRDADCGPLPSIRTPRFSPGEMLDYDIDVLTANAARMELLALPASQGRRPVRVQVWTNTFFNKIRRVKAQAVSTLRGRDLHPVRYTEDAWEDDEHKLAEVDFHPPHQPPASVVIRTADRSSPSHTAIGRYGHDALDTVGAVYLVRSLDLKPGMRMCFDVYAMQKMWRVWGEVSGIERVATPAGEFDAFHIAGTAAELTNHAFQRELHLWITADDRRIPVGAMGAIDLGPIRAVLTHAGRIDDQQPKQSHVDEVGW